MTTHRPTLTALKAHRHQPSPDDGCRGTGYRPDFLFFDHPDTAPGAVDCEALRRPCAVHACYWL